MQKRSPVISHRFLELRYEMRKDPVISINNLKKTVKAINRSRSLKYKKSSVV